MMGLKRLINRPAWILAVALLLIWVDCPAFLDEDSAFYPRISSGLETSLLQVNSVQGSSEPLPARPGLWHPFRAWDDLKDSVREAFSPGQPERALLQYAQRDRPVDFLGELNFVAGYEQRYDDPGAYGFLYKGVGFNSVLNDNFRLRALWWNGAYLGDRQAAEASPLLDSFYTLREDALRLDNLNADISYRNSWFTAALGRGKFQLGSSVSGSLILSDRVNDYGYFLAEGRVGDFQLSFLHGSLMAAREPEPARGATDVIPDKYVALHQVSYSPSECLKLFGGETIIYGNRGIDLNYLLPHTFWRVTEHNQWDRDNVLIFAGLDLQPTRNLSLYLNGVLDELTYSRLFTSWWGNKYALQTGAALALPSLSLTSQAPPRFLLEFTAVRPWTYTHYSNQTMYSHDGIGLGYAKGSNLLDLTAELDLPLREWLTFCAQYSHTWQGSEGNTWALDYSDYFQGSQVDNATCSWLEGELSRISKLQGSLRFDLLAHHSLLLAHTTQFGASPRYQWVGSWQFKF